MNLEIVTAICAGALTGAAVAFVAFRHGYKMGYKYGLAVRSACDGPISAGAVRTNQLSDGAVTHNKLAIGAIVLGRKTPDAES